MQLDDLESLEWPDRVVAFLHANGKGEGSSGSEFRSPSRIGRPFLVLLLGMVFTIFIYGLLLDRVSWLLIILTRNDQHSVASTELLLIASYVILAGGFSYFLFSWAIQQYRVHVLLHEVTASRFELDPVLISSRQPVVFARSSSRFIRNVVIQGIKKRFVSLTMHLRLPYSAKFAGYHLEILRADDVPEDQRDQFYPLSTIELEDVDGHHGDVDGTHGVSLRKNRVLQLISKKRSIQEPVLVTSDQEAYLQLKKCLHGHYQENFQVLLQDNKFRYLSISQVDRGGFAAYKIHLLYKGMNRSVIRRMFTLLEIVTGVLVREHEPTLSFPSSRNQKIAEEILPNLVKDDEEEVTPAIEDFSKSASWNQQASNYRTSDDVASSSSQGNSATFKGPISSNSSSKMDMLRKHFQNHKTKLRFPEEALDEIAKLLVHASSFEIISHSHLQFRIKSSGKDIVSWELNSDTGDEDSLQLRVQKEVPTVTPHPFVIQLWRVARQDRWKIDGTVPNDVVQHVLLDPIVGSCLNEIIPPVYLAVSALSPEMLEVRISFSKDAAENIRPAYILSQELPWLLLLLI